MSNNQTSSSVVSKTIASQMAAKNVSARSQQNTKTSAQTTQNTKTYKKKTPKKMDYSKQIIHDIRGLLWIVSIGALALAFYCIHKGYTGSLPWISTLSGLPWAAHATISSFYFNMAKSDHLQGITFEAAKAANFGVPVDLTAAANAARASSDSPSI